MSQTKEILAFANHLFDFAAELAAREADLITREADADVKEKDIEAAADRLEVLYEETKAAMDEHARIVAEREDHAEIAGAMLELKAGAGLH